MSSDSMQGDRDLRSAVLECAFRFVVSQGSSGCRLRGGQSSRQRGARTGHSSLYSASARPDAGSVWCHFATTGIGPGRRGGIVQGVPVVQARVKKSSMSSMSGISAPEKWYEEEDGLLTTDYGLLTTDQ